MRRQSYERLNAKNNSWKIKLIAEINKELRMGFFENKALRNQYRRLYRNGILRNTRFIRFHKQGWRLVEVNAKLEKQLHSILSINEGKKSQIILFILKLLLELLGEDNDKNKPHYLISPSIKQSIRYTPNTGEPRNCIPEFLVGKKLVIRNVWSLNYTKADGYSSSQFTNPKGALYQFEKTFLTKVHLDLKSHNKSYLLNALNGQFKDVFPNKRFKTNQALSANLFELNVQESEILVLASIAFYDIYKYHGVKYPLSSLRFIQKTYPKLFTFYSKFVVLESGCMPPIEELKFLVTVSSLKSSLKNLVNRSHNTTKIKQIFKLLDNPRKRNALSTQITIKTDDVFKAGLFVDFNLTKTKIMREIRNDAITNFALALFKNKEVLTFIKKKFKEIKLPNVKNSQLIFTGQHRNGGEYSSIYEDGIIQGKDDNGKMVNISILVKNTMLEDPDRHIKDYLKSLHTPNDYNAFILIDITHPQDIQKLSIINQRIRNTVITEGLGVINIGIFEGFKGVKYLGQVYGALMQARRSSKKDKINFAIEKLIGYGFDVDNNMKEELKFLNNTFDELEISGDLNQASWDQTLRFVKKYVERYKEYLCS